MSTQLYITGSNSMTYQQQFKKNKKIEKGQKGNRFDFLASQTKFQ